MAVVARGGRLQGMNEVGCRLVGSVDGVEVVVVVGITKTGVEEDSRVGEGEGLGVEEEFST